MGEKNDGNKTGLSFFIFRHLFFVNMSASSFAASFISRPDP